MMMLSNVCIIIETSCDFHTRKTREWDEFQIEWQPTLNIVGVYYAGNMNQIITPFRFKLLSFELNIIFKGFTIDIFHCCNTFTRLWNEINVDFLFDILDFPITSLELFNSTPRATTVRLYHTNRPATHKIQIENLYSSLKVSLDNTQPSESYRNLNFSLIVAAHFNIFCVKLFSGFPIPHRHCQLNSGNCRCTTF